MVWKYAPSGTSYDVLQHVIQRDGVLCDPQLALHVGTGTHSASIWHADLSMQTHAAPQHVCVTAAAAAPAQHMCCM